MCSRSTKTQITFDPRRTIVVGKIPTRFNEEQVEKFLSSFMKVTDVRFVHANYDKNRRTAIVQLESVQELGELVSKTKRTLDGVALTFKRYKRSGERKKTLKITDIGSDGYVKTIAKDKVELVGPLKQGKKVKRKSTPRGRRHGHEAAILKRRRDRRKSRNANAGSDSDTSGETQGERQLNDSVFAFLSKKTSVKQWSMGRDFEASGQLGSAIKCYDKAIEKTLQTLKTQRQKKRDTSGDQSDVSSSLKSASSSFKSTSSSGRSTSSSFRSVASEDTSSTGEQLFFEKGAMVLKGGKIVKPFETKTPKKPETQKHEKDSKNLTKTDIDALMQECRELFGSKMDV